MRKLKLQMQTSVDGFVSGPEGQLDWMTNWGEDEKLVSFVNHLTDSSDTILLGRKMTEGFIKYWESVASDSPDYPFARKMVSYSKVVFSKTLDAVEGQNVQVETGPLKDVVNHLKGQEGKDIIVYGGAGFVSSLLEHSLLDELHLFVNPVALGQGMPIFKTRTPLKLTASTTYASGVVVNTYALTPK